MNDTIGCQHIRQLLGVYVLGAIDPAERAQVDAHLAGCAECREELAGLAGLPALLGRVSFDEAARIAGVDAVGRLSGQESSAGLPPGDPADVVDLTSLLGRAAQRRRMNRWRGLVAAAAVTLIGAGAAIGITHAAAGGRPAAIGPHWQTVWGTDTSTHARVEVRYARMPWGTSLDTEVSGIPVGTECEFWVMGSGGQKWLAGSWDVASTWHSTWYPGSSWVPEGAVRGFEITSGQKVLVHVTAT